MTVNHCSAAFACASAKHFTVGPKMAGMRVVSPSWQGLFDTPPWGVCLFALFLLLVDPSSTQKTGLERKTEDFCHLSRALQQMRSQWNPLWIYCAIRRYFRCCFFTFLPKCLIILSTWQSLLKAWSGPQVRFNGIWGRAYSRCCTLVLKLALLISFRLPI